MIKKKQIAVNLITNILAMSISMLISLWITPYLIHELGFAEYGYIGIIGNLIALMAVLTYTLNSMVARFLTVSFEKEGAQEASKYMSSALYTNILAGLLLMTLIFFLTRNLREIITINLRSVGDVKLAFFVSGIAFILSSISIVFSSGAYSRNRLDIINGINIFSNIVRALFIISIFSLFHAQIWLYALASVVQVSITLIGSFISCKVLLPSIHFNVKLFRSKMSFELLSSGFFNSVIMLGNVFLTQIDLIVGNRYLPAEIVGMYAAILLIPNSIRNVSIALSSAFAPTTLILYSSGNMQALREYSNKVIKFCGLMLGWPVAIASGLAIPVLYIWLGKDYSNYELMIILMLLPLTVNLAVSQLYNVQQAFNKVKVPALASILLGVANLVLAIFFTASLRMGIFGIVLSGVLMSTVRTFIFIPIYTAIITKQPAFAYYKGLINPLLSSSITCSIGIIIQKYFNLDTFFSVFCAAIALSIIYLSIALVLLIHEDREYSQRIMLSVASKIYALIAK